MEIDFAYDESNAFYDKIDEDLDLAFALYLQDQYTEEVKENAHPAINSISAVNDAEKGHNHTPTSVIDKEWELLDPTPDIHSLFIQFNAKYFWNKLQGVEVKWSPRMTLCAGVCSYEGYGGLCSVRLSLPLLKLRPRKDLVETLLHEMIHAYLFVTHNNKDHDAHGPEFLKHMHRINKESGAHVTVYHSFHDEVDEYRKHWWQCSGPCKKKSPFFGLVKRASNRAPSANDNWWASHQATCSGTFVKIKEPEGYSNKRKRDAKEDHSLGDIRKFISPVAKSGKDKTKSIGSIDRTKPVKKAIADVIPFSGKGYTLGSASSSLGAVKHENSAVKNLFPSRNATSLSMLRTSQSSTGSGVQFNKGSSTKGSGGSTKMASGSRTRTVVIKQPTKNVPQKKKEETTTKKKEAFSGSGNVLGGSIVPPKNSAPCSTPSKQNSPPKLVQSPIKSYFSPVRAQMQHSLIFSSSDEDDFIASPKKMHDCVLSSGGMDVEAPSDIVTAITKNNNNHCVFSLDDVDDEVINVSSRNSSLNVPVRQNESSLNDTESEIVDISPHDDKVNCPACGQRVEKSLINIHLDHCLL